MKLATLVFLVACLQAWTTGHTQTITLSEKNAPLEKLFKEIKRQTGYAFIYTNEVLSSGKPVTIKVKNADLKDVLNICLYDQPLVYAIVDDHIVITAKDATTIAPSIDQLIDVKGRVLNEKNEPVEGVSVKVKGTDNGTSTNVDGEFFLSGVTEAAILVFSGTNVETNELKINGKNYLEISLKTKVNKLDEIQIIAYGTNTQRYNVGSVSKVTSEEISKQPVSNALAALEGRVPGLTVVSTSGLPGASFKIQIRGQNSMNPDPNNSIPPLDNPLIIIDGVPFAPQNANLNQLTSVAAPGISMGLNNPYGGISPFSSINPNDIESIEVLRDADATAIYGSRGSNGVILITMKKGVAGKTKFQMNLYTGISHVTRTMQMMNTEEYLETRREAFANDGLVPDTDPGNSSTYAPDVLLFDTTKNTNWTQYFLGDNANTTDINASLSGGSSTTQFLIASGFHHEGYLLPSNLSDNKASVNFNLHHVSSNHRFLLDLSNNYSFDKNHSSSAGFVTPNLLVGYSLPPDYPDLVQDGNTVWNYNGVSLGGSVTATNPYSFLLKKYLITTHNLLSNLLLEYSIAPGLKIRSSFGYNYLASSEYSGNPASSQDPNGQVLRSADFGDNKINSWIIEPQMEYNKVFNKQKLNILIGGTWQENQNVSTLINASGYPNDALIESVSGAPNKTVSDGNSDYKYNGFFGRINYLLLQKYILNITGRRDGSSRFGPGKQFGNFGSIGGGWLFSEERFIKNLIPAISYGKLRATYGSTGNDKIGDYQFLSRWAPTLFTYQGSLGYTSLNLYNPNFGWAVTKKLEFGVELGLLNDRIVLNATWYRDRSDNQLVVYPLASQTGFINVLQNLPALVENRGWEFQLNSSNIKTKSFTWTTSFNFTVPENKLVSFPNLENSSYAGTYFTGHSLSVLSKFKYIGVNQGTGIFEFLTASGDSTSSPTSHAGKLMNDEQLIGDLDPKFYGGLNNSLSFKGFQLDIFLEFKKQLGLNYLGQLYSTVLPGNQINLPTTLLARWQKPGDVAEFERLTALGYSPAAFAARFYFVQSSGAYSDASYIRFKTVAFSYNVPAKILSKSKLAGCRIYLNAQNLFTISNYKGNDPETQSFYGLPPLRTIVAGIQFNF